MEAQDSGALELVELRVNGVGRRVGVEPRRLLVDVLREDLGLTGTNVGCSQGVCGSCTVLVDGATVRSCLMLAVQAHGRDVVTVEGLADGAAMHPVQQAFLDAQAQQCGFCTPGFLATAVELVERDTQPSETEIREALAGNVCRCTGYEHIVDAVIRAAEAQAETREAG
ncbi:(2Fe-2S)-binding protein [Pseudonocardia thermophila]|jgi:Aerobic-type carbon monoxide dehydrogenase, small subunit CoxS/CutS homologs|uniref:(2Fe-2S)-binding protein n=1 Tax=Pseudonocardia thermophila TaxID=1848 RepID=UPI00248E2AE3|nr:(2Fe-2S)-binding protein [Pseudonocardia thermophila]